MKALSGSLLALVCILFAIVPVAVDARPGGVESVGAVPLDGGVIIEGWRLSLAAEGVDDRMPGPGRTPGLHKTVHAALIRADRPGLRADWTQASFPLRLTVLEVVAGYGMADTERRGSTARVRTNIAAGGTAEHGGVLRIPLDGVGPAVRLSLHCRTAAGTVFWLTTTDIRWQIAY